MKPTRSLAGKVAIVTGGASGIGSALSVELAHRGCEVVLADRQEALAQQVADGIRAAGGQATGAPLDVRDRGAFRSLVEDTVARRGAVDLLFNNAGIGVGREMSEYQPEDFDDVLDVNLRGVAHGIQAVYPQMIKQGSGHIVNTASVAGLVATGGAGSYTATKHAVVGLTKALRIEGERHGVRASVLCPGAIRTPILTGGRFGRIQLRGGSKASIMKQWERVRPMDPADFARRALDRVVANDPIIVVPSFWKAVWYLDRLSPSLTLALGAWIHERLRAELEADEAEAARSPARTNGHSTARSP
jgi:NAD(P)-dependent dehydrogenase (short-subunit alcohol dehydrogenase family)